MIQVGTDFSGVGAFEQALNRLGIEYKTIFSCDIDNYVRKTYIANYGKPDYYPFDVYDREIPKRSGNKYNSIKTNFYINDPVLYMPDSSLLEKIISLSNEKKELKF